MTVDVAGVYAASAAANGLSEQFARRSAPVPVELHFPALPEVAAFVQAMSQARERHARSLAMFEAFFDAAGRGLEEFAGAIDMAESGAVGRFSGLTVSGGEAR